MSIMPPEPDGKTDQPDPLSPAMRELADGIAQYVESFVYEATDHKPPTIDWQYMAEDFVESCVVDIMRVDRAPWNDEHTPYRYRPTGDQFCRVCSHDWPCPTVRGDA